LIFNENIHNHAEIVNAQLIDELKKFDEIPLKGEEQININGNQINGESVDIKFIDNKKCPNHFKILKELKNYFGINKNYLLEENKNILRLITFPDDSET